MVESVLPDMAREIVTATINDIICRSSGSHPNFLPYSLVSSFPLSQLHWTSMGQTSTLLHHHHEAPPTQSATANQIAPSSTASTHVARATIPSAPSWCVCVCTSYTAYKMATAYSLQILRQVILSLYLRTAMSRSHTARIQQRYIDPHYMVPTSPHTLCLALPAGGYCSTGEDDIYPTPDL